MSNSYAPSISGDGQFIAFVSEAENLVEHDTNMMPDIFLYDRSKASLVCVSYSLDRKTGNGQSSGPALSADGNFLAFVSIANDLTTTKIDNGSQIYCYDVKQQKIVCISKSAGGVAGNQSSFAPVISADGTVIAFLSDATNLVDDDTNNVTDVFVCYTKSGNISRINLSPEGKQADSESTCLTISGDGRFVAYSSTASNIIQGDVNGKSDVFLYDSMTKKTICVSKVADGITVNDDSGLLCLSISFDGRYIAYLSKSSDVLLGEKANAIYVYDQKTGKTFCATPASAKNEVNLDFGEFALSSDGRYLVFKSSDKTLVANDNNGVTDVFRCDLIDHKTIRISESADGLDANGLSSSGFGSVAISRDGTTIAFASYSDNLNDNDINKFEDVFVWEQYQVNANNSIDIYCISSSLTQQANDYCETPVISSDGNWIAFASRATTIQHQQPQVESNNQFSQIYLYNQKTASLALISIAKNGTQVDGDSYDPVISADGSVIAFSSFASNLVPGDLNDKCDIFVYDTHLKNTKCISINKEGFSGDGHSRSPSISADGRYVSFVSSATNLIEGDTNNAPDIFVYDRQTGAIRRISCSNNREQANGPSRSPAISGNGKFIAFWSAADNLVSGDSNKMPDIYLYDMVAGKVERISIPSDGINANGPSYDHIAVNFTGMYTVFSSYADNLVANDKNQYSDVFLYDRELKILTCVSISSDNMFGNGPSFDPSISDDGNFVTFRSMAKNFVTDSPVDFESVYVRNMKTKCIMRLSTTYNGVAGNKYSDIASICSDGHRAVFTSEANNLVAYPTRYKNVFYINIPFSFLR